MAAPDYGFGAGTIWGTSTATGATPIKFGALQDVSFDFSPTVKTLFGGYQFPLAARRGTVKVTGKAKFAQIQGAVYDALFFGQAGVTGQTLVANGESASIPATPGPYTVTVANSATWVTDLGVIFSLTGLPLVKVASAPATGQYSVSAGVYTFAAADQALGVKISYTYTSPTGGTTTSYTNQLLGFTPTFSMVFNQVNNGQQFTFTFPQCTASKLSIPTKLEDYIIQEFDFEIFADASGTIFTKSTVA